MNSGDENYGIMSSFSTHIVQQLHAMLHEHAASDSCEAPFIITFGHYKQICATAPSATIRELCSATSSHQRAARELFIGIATKKNITCIEMQQQCLDDGKADQATQGARFECCHFNDGTTCETLCGYELAIGICSDAQKHGVALPFRILVIDQHTRAFYRAKVTDQRHMQERVALLLSRACRAIGCSASFDDPEHAHGFTYEPKMPADKHKYGVDGLCKKHKYRLDRSTAKAAYTNVIIMDSPGACSERCSTMRCEAAQRGRALHRADCVSR